MPELKTTDEDGAVIELVSTDGGAYNERPIDVQFKNPLLNRGSARRGSSPRGSSRRGSSPHSSPQLSRASSKRRSSVINILNDPNDPRRGSITLEISESMTRSVSVISDEGSSMENMVIIEDVVDDDSDDFHALPAITITHDDDDHDSHPGITITQHDDDCSRTPRNTIPSIAINDEQPIDVPTIMVTNEERAIDVPTIMVTNEERAIDVPTITVTNEERAIDVPTRKVTNRERAIDVPTRKVTNRERAIDVPAIMVNDSAATDTTQPVPKHEPKVMAVKGSPHVYTPKPEPKKKQNVPALANNGLQAEKPSVNANQRSFNRRRQTAPAGGVGGLLGSSPYSSQHTSKSNTPLIDEKSSSHVGTPSGLDNPAFAFPVDLPIADANGETMVSIVMGGDNPACPNQQDEFQSNVYIWTMMLSTMYAITLVLIGTAMPMTEAFRQTWVETHASALFLCYLHIMSVVFLIYLQIDLHLTARKDKKAKKAAEENKTDQAAELEQGQCDTPIESPFKRGFTAAPPVIPSTPATPVDPTGPVSVERAAAQVQTLTLNSGLVIRRSMRRVGPPPMAQQDGLSLFPPAEMIASPICTPAITPMPSFRRRSEPPSMMTVNGPETTPTSGLAPGTITIRRSIRKKSTIAEDDQEPPTPTETTLAPFRRSQVHRASSRRSDKPDITRRANSIVSSNISADYDDDDEEEMEEIYDMFLSMNEAGSMTHEGASFYLRLGCLMFGIANFVLVVLNIHADLNSKPGCELKELTYPSYFHMILLLVQTYFILKNTHIHVKRRKGLVRFGILHVLATNLCIWMRVCILEIIHAFHVGSAGNEHHDNDGNSYGNSYGNNPNYSTTTYPGSYQDDYHHVRRRAAEAAPGCGSSFIESLYPYLLPFVLEYSLIVVAVMASMYHALNLRISKDVLSSLKNYLHSANEENNDKKEEHEQFMSKSNRGLFLGVLMLTVALVGIIMFNFNTGNDNEKGATEVFYWTDLIIQVFMLIACITCMYQLRKFSVSFNKNNSIDNILLLVSMSGLALLNVFLLVASMSALDTNNYDPAPGLYLTLLTMFTSLVNIAQGMIQTSFIMDGLQRCASNADQVKNKPCRGMITFLVISNVALWIFKTFQVKKLHLVHMEEYFGSISWHLLLNVCLPFQLFFRFHSSVCLAEMWVSVYEKEHGPEYKAI